MKPIFLIPTAFLITVTACNQPASTDTKSTQGNAGSATPLIVVFILLIT